MKTCTFFVNAYYTSVKVRMRYSLIPKVKLKNKILSVLGEYKIILDISDVFLFFETCLRAVQLNVRKQVSHSSSTIINCQSTFLFIWDQIVTTEAFCGAIYTSFCR